MDFQSLFMILFKIYNYIFNFYQTIKKTITDKYNNLKIELFDNTVVRFDIYDLDSNRYIKIFDNETLFTILLALFGIQPDMIIHPYDITYVGPKHIKIVKYYYKGKIHHAIYDKSFNSQIIKELTKQKSIIYFIIDKNEDITIQLMPFITSLYMISDGISINILIDIIEGFYGINLKYNNESLFKLMLDDDSYQEKIFKEKEILIL